MCVLCFSVFLLIPKLRKLLFFLSQKVLFQCTPCQKIRICTNYRNLYSRKISFLMSKSIRCTQAATLNICVQSCVDPSLYMKKWTIVIVRGFFIGLAMITMHKKVFYMLVEAGCRSWVFHVKGVLWRMYRHKNIH